MKQARHERTSLARLFAAAAAAAIMLVSFPSSGVYECGGEVDDCPCGRDTPCICCACGNCVWWAWHEACCHWGRALEWCTDAGTWDNYASTNGYPMGTDARVQSIFVCEPSSVCSGWGHVGWITNVHADGSFDSTEMACGGWCGVQSRTRSGGFAEHYIYNPDPSTECSPGDTEEDGCGNCGTRSRTCGGDGMWGDWGSCSGEGECARDATQDRDCGNCGTQTRTCSSSCSWGDWGACSGEGECSEGSTRDCGECGEQVCGSDCSWGTCQEDPPCNPDPVEDASTDTGPGDAVDAAADITTEADLPAKPDVTYDTEPDHITPPDADDDTGPAPFGLESGCTCVISR